MTAPVTGARAGIVIVNYRSHDLLAGLAEGTLAGTEALVVVVDNFSDAAEQGRVRELCSRLGWEAVLLATNTGFGGGVNAGIRRALDQGCATITALNPDVEAEPAVLRELHRHALAEPGALISPVMVRADGTSYFRGSQLHLRTGQMRGGWEGVDREPSAQWRGWLTGACLVFHRDVVARAGFLDESYFLYWEDVEWSFRARQAGIRLVLRTDLVVVHDEGGTQRSASDPRVDDAKSARYYFYNCRNRLLFAINRLPRRTGRSWVRHTPAQSWSILRRGGRRHLLRHPSHVVAAVLGTLAGLLAWGRSGRPAATARPDPAPARSIVMTHPGSELYGSDRMFLESVLGFVQARWRVVVVLPEAGPLVRRLELAGAAVVLIPTVVVRKSLLHPARLLGTLLALARAVSSHLRLLHRERPDAVYVNTVTLPVWLLAARLAGVRSLCHVHEAESTVGRAVRFLLYAPTALADKLIMNSEFSLDVCARSAVGVRPRSVVVYNGVLGPADPPDPLRGQVDELRLLYVGRLSPRKGPQVAVDALALLRRQGRPAKLELLGSVFPGYEWFESELVDQVRRLELQDHVTFSGFHPEIWTRFADADIVLVPSTVDEPFGNTAVEAQLAGRALVVSANGGLAEATSGYGAVAQARPGDPGDVAGAIDELLDRWPEVVEHAVDDARRASERYSPETFWDAIVTTTDELVSR